MRRVSFSLAHRSHVDKLLLVIMLVGCVEPGTKVNTKSFPLSVVVTENLGDSADDEMPEEIINLFLPIQSERCAGWSFIPETHLVRVDLSPPAQFTFKSKKGWRAWLQRFLRAQTLEIVEENTRTHLGNHRIGEEFAKSGLSPDSTSHVLSKYIETIGGQRLYFYQNTSDVTHISLHSRVFAVQTDLEALKNDIATIICEYSDADSPAGYTIVYNYGISTVTKVDPPPPAISPSPVDSAIFREPEPAESVEDVLARAQKSYAEENYNKALPLFLEAVERGAADVQVYFILGKMYVAGLGATQSDQMAATWFTKAAEQGHAEAQFSLGLMYREGQGATQSDQMAATWLTKAAEQGHAEAQFYLGRLHFRGEGVEQSDEEAAKWFRKAAEQGHANAQFSLGLMYREGQGATQSDQMAATWFTKAAEQGHAEAQFYVGWMYENSKGVAQSDTEAARWYRKSAEQGHANAQFSLGLMYREGQGATQSDQMAATWFTKAAEQGHAEAQFYLGRLHFRGEGVEQSDEEAAKWFRKAAEQGHERAKRALERLIGNN